MFSLSRSVVSSWRYCKPACLCFKPYVSCLPFSADLWKSKAAPCAENSRCAAQKRGKLWLSETVWIDWLDPKENPVTIGTRNLLKTSTWYKHGRNMVETCTNMYKLTTWFPDLLAWRRFRFWIFEPTWIFTSGWEDLRAYLEEKGGAKMSIIWSGRMEGRFISTSD